MQPDAPDSHKLENHLKSQCQITVDDSHLVPLKLGSQINLEFTNRHKQKTKSHSSVGKTEAKINTSTLKIVYLDCAVAIRCAGN